MKSLIIILLTAIFLQFNYSQEPVRQWIVAAPVNPTPKFGSFCIDSLGNVFMSGPDYISPPGISTYKFSSSGQQMWTRRNVLGGGLAPKVTKMGCDVQGNVYIAGYDDSYFLIKYSSNGILRWVKRYDGVWLEDLEITQDGYPIVSGTSVDGNPYRAVFYTVKVNPATGDTMWTATYLGPIGSENYAMDASNIISLTGTAFRYNPFIFDILTVKYNSDGIFQWARTAGNFYSPYDVDAGYDVANDLNDNIIVTAWADQKRNDPRIATIKYLPNGDTAWVRIYNHPGNRETVPINVKTDNLLNVIIAGYGVFLPNGNNIVTIKYNQTGNLLWGKSFRKPNSLTTAHENLAIDKNNNIYVIGTNDHFPRNARDLAVIKYDPNGNLLWDISYVSPDSISNGSNIIVDKHFNVYLHGQGQLPTGGQTGAIILKYSQPIGIEPISTEIPEKFELHQNYPNPFNPITKIKFSVSKKAFVKITIYDAAGKEISKIVNQELEAGIYETEFNAGNISSGVYFYKFVVSDSYGEAMDEKRDKVIYSETRKMVVVK